MNEPSTLPPSPASQPASGEGGGCYERLRAGILRWAESRSPRTNRTTEALLAFPDFLRLLCGLAGDTEIPPNHKAKIALVMLYVLSPLDLFPEAIFGPAAYIDDMVLIVFALDQLLNHVDEAVLRRHWKGSGDVIGKLRHFVAVADLLVGSGLLRRIKAFLEA